MSTQYLIMIVLSMLQIHGILGQDPYCDTKYNNDIKYLVESERLKNIIRGWGGHMLM